LEPLPEHEWDEGQPIYRQVRDMLAEMILDGQVGEGESLPVVRHLATGFRLSPLTVLKGYQKLVEEGVVESRRGRGMVVKENARKKLLAAERERFLSYEWPKAVDMIHRLGLDVKELKGLGQN